MSLPKPLSEIVQEAIDLLAEDIPQAIGFLSKVLPATSPRQDELFLLQARYKDARELSIAGVADVQQVTMMENTIRRDLLLLIRSLTEQEFEKAAQQSGSKDKPSNLLYRIPNAMQLNEETLCKVRIALDPDILEEDFEMDEHTQKRHIRKVSKSMLVELFDPSGGKHFNIRPTSSSVQTIDLEGEDYTEWRIFVTPLTPGEHLLELKVCVIELVDGEREVRERVLEEKIKVLAEGATRSADETPEKVAGPALAFAGEADLAPPPPAPPEPPPSKSLGYPELEIDDMISGRFPTKKPSGPASRPAPRPKPEALPKKRRSSGGLRTAALFLVFLLVGTSVGWAVTPPVTRDWWVASIRNTEEAYTAYINKYDTTSPHCEKAYFKRAKLSDDPQVVRSYLEYVEREPGYNDIGHKKQVTAKLEQLELQALESIRKNPSLPEVKTFLQNFPKTEHLDELKSISNENPEWEGDLPYQLRTGETGAIDPKSEGVTPSHPLTTPENRSPETKNLKPETNKEPETTKESHPGKSGLTMVKVKGGTFTMGCVDGRDGDCEDDEKPAHEVTLSDFEIGQYEVTQADWQKVMGSNPSEFQGCYDCPVESVSWNDVKEFIQKLNAQTGRNYRLPTEAEWEYAARGGQKSKGYTYAGSNNIDAVAWYDRNDGRKTHPVGTKQPNELGLYDMSGNVWEWCQDWYGYYPSEPDTNPKGPNTSSSRVLRGSSWGNGSRYVRVAYRSWGSPADRYNFYGFRLARARQ